jgi:uncharacterized protein YggE
MSERVNMRKDPAMRLRTGLILAVLLLTGIPGRARAEYPFSAMAGGPALAGQGQASAPPQTAVILLYLRSEVKPDGSGERQLALAWAQAKQWLTNFGIKPEQIIVREPAARMFLDQKKYFVQKVTLIQKLTGNNDEDLESLAQLIDQASARGLLPVSQLVMVAQEQDPPLPSQVPDVQNHFLFFLPANEQELVDRAIRDGVKHVRAEAERVAKATHLENPKLRALNVEYSNLQPTDLKTGQIGIAGVALGDIHVNATVTGAFDTKDPPAGQTLGVSGTGKIEIPAERVLIQSRISAGDSSLQKALGHVAEQVARVQSGVEALGAKLELGGVSFFSGNPGAFGVLEAGQGEVPAGVYRDVRVILERGEKESEADLKKRGEKIVAVVHPKAATESNANDNPFVQVMWGPKAPDGFVDKALVAAVEDARSNARRVAAAVGGKVGGVLDVEVNLQESTALSNPYLGLMSSGFPGAADYSAMTRIGEKPSIAVGVSVKFGAEIP